MVLPLIPATSWSKSGCIISNVLNSNGTVSQVKKEQEKGRQKVHHKVHIGKGIGPPRVSPYLTSVALSILHQYWCHSYRHRLKILNIPPTLKCAGNSRERKEEEMPSPLSVSTETFNSFFVSIKNRLKSKVWMILKQNTYCIDTKW